MFTVKHKEPTISYRLAKIFSFSLLIARLSQLLKCKILPFLKGIFVLTWTANYVPKPVPSSAMCFPSLKLWSTGNLENVHRIFKYWNFSFCLLKKPAWLEKKKQKKEQKQNLLESSVWFFFPSPQQHMATSAACLMDNDLLALTFLQPKLLKVASR